MTFIFALNARIMFSYHISERLLGREEEEGREARTRTKDSPPRYFNFRREKTKGSSLLSIFSFEQRKTNQK
jgi:hypothetical protein